MKVLVYSIKDYERSYLEHANKHQFQVDYTDLPLSAETAIRAKGYDAVSIFTHDTADEPVLAMLYAGGTRYIAVRAAGYDNVDINAANQIGIRVANVPDYSPYAIAEHAVALVQAVNRKLIVADTNVHGYNFTVSRLVGSDLHGKTVGIIGTGKIGSIVAKIMHGFGCHLLGFDIRENRDLTEKYHLQYKDLKSLCFGSDIITVHVCLNEQTRHLINREMISYMKPGVIFVNTARGAIVDTDALVDALQSGIIGAAGLDVYEHEKGIFFNNLSGKELQDPLLRKLLNFPNVLITPHQGFATKEALQNIADGNFKNLFEWSCNRRPMHELGQIIAKPGKATSRMEIL